MSREEISLKLLVVGEVACGKTSYVRRVTTGEYSHGAYRATIGVDFHSKRLKNRWNGRNVYVNVWDIAGRKLLIYNLLT